MNAATYEEPIALEYVSVSAVFGSLLPWMTPLGHVEISQSRTSSAMINLPRADLEGNDVMLAALRVSEQLLRQFFDDSPISVVVFDAAGRLHHVNRAFSAMLGYGLEDLKDRNIDELMYPEDVPAIQERRRLLVEGRCNEFQVQTRFGSGCRRQVCTRMCGRLEQCGGDRPPRIFAHLVDVSEIEHRMGAIQREADEVRCKNWDPERYL